LPGVLQLALELIGVLAAPGSKHAATTAATDAAAPALHKVQVPLGFFVANSGCTKRLLRNDDLARNNNNK
jgi:hypothetical protein